MKKCRSIEEIMTLHANTISSDESVSKVIESMNNNNFDHLPVVDNVLEYIVDEQSES